MLLLASAAAEGPCGLRAADVTLRPGMGPARQHNEYLVLKKLMVLSDNGTALPHTLQKAAPRVYRIPEPIPPHARVGMNYSRAALEDEILTLPGMDVEALPFRMFAGYLNVSRSRRIFYWFVESEKEPDKDPLAIWFNGGPGASGLTGLLLEHGPFRPTRGGVGLKRNPYAWNRVANMLYLESPVGVGYSYSTQGEMLLNDQLILSDNHRVLEAFFKRFPHLKEQDLFLTGQSYAGHFVPQLAKLLVDRHEDLHFKGFAVGNPLTDPVERVVGEIQSFFGHGLVPYDTYHHWWRQCGSTKSFDVIYKTQACVDLYWEMWDHIGAVNPFAVDGAICSEETAQAANIHVSPRQLPGVAAQADASLPFEPCANLWATLYFNREDVKAAIHAEPSVVWREDNPSIYQQFDEASMHAYMEPIYDFLIQNSHLRILVYSGDDDAVCSTSGTEMWISDMHWSKRSDYLSWHMGNGQVAGFLQKYEGGFTFATVRGGGHAVTPQRPDAALALLSAYFDDRL